MSWIAFCDLELHSLKAGTLLDSTEAKDAIWQKQAMEMPGYGKHGKP
jgi:hypothetical protein